MVPAAVLLTGSYIFVCCPLSADDGTVTLVDLPGIERLTALQDLWLTDINLEPACLLRMTTCLTELRLDLVFLQRDAAPQLLQLLAQLPALRVLQVTNSSIDHPQHLSLCSALTASSNLQELELCGFIEEEVWAHVFPACRKLLHLTSLITQKSEEAMVLDEYALDSEDIAHLAACCQNVRHLDVIPTADASLAPLMSLTALTSLVLGRVLPTMCARLPS